MPRSPSQLRELLTVLNVPLMLVAIDEMTVKIATPTIANITAYSTAVGPSSLPMKFRIRIVSGRILVSTSERPAAQIGHGGT